jgi:hypothetical protein
VIHDELEFYNVAELNRVEGVDGLRLQRVPEHVRCQLSDGTAGVMLSPAGSEIRFRIAEANDSVTIRLSSESRTTIYIYHGPFQAGAIELDTEPRDFKIAPHKRIAQLMQVGGPPMAYDPRLVRLCFGGVYPEPVLYHGHSGGVRPPQPQDTPDRTYLAYGSSITHGTDWAGAACSYPAHVAWRLGYDLRNLGASGCCLCEKPLADYLAQQPCDLVTLELSVNMLGSSFTAEGFRQRAGYLVERIADADPDRPVACITVLPHFRDIPRFLLFPGGKGHRRAVPPGPPRSRQATGSPQPHFDRRTGPVARHRRPVRRPHPPRRPRHGPDRRSTGPTAWGSGRVPVKAFIGNTAGGSPPASCRSGV